MAFKEIGRIKRLEFCVCFSTHEQLGCIPDPCVHNLSSIMRAAKGISYLHIHDPGGIPGYQGLVHATWGRSRDCELKLNVKQPSVLTNS